MSHTSSAPKAIFAAIAAGFTALPLCLVSAGCTSTLFAPAPDDVFVLSIGDDLQGESHTGRLEVMFITEQDRRWSMRQPLRGPWMENPQPIASWSIENWNGSSPLTLAGRDASVFAGPIDGLVGAIRVQALLHINDNLHRLVPGSGCLYSDVVTHEFNDTASDRVEISLTRRIGDFPDHDLPGNLRVVDVRSELLSDVLGREVLHRCAVALPTSYDEQEDARWPVVFVIPDRLDHPMRSAIEHAQMLAIPGVDDIAPHAIHVILDPHTAWGHHGFVDSAFHGPRLTALVTELLPHLHAQFRLRNMREARLVTGVGLGGWSALWMTLQHPDVFGGCWATAPSPVDFHALQNVDLYNADNAFIDSTGSPNWAFRTTGMAIDEMIPSTTSLQMWRMEQALDPNGRSGGLWQTWHHMYSPVDSATGQPQPLFNPDSGLIDTNVAQHWQQYDIARILHADLEMYLPILADRVHVFCGELDSYYFDRAVRRLRDALLEHGEEGASAAASILLIEGAIHDNAQRYVFDDWNQQMRDHLHRHGVNVPSLKE